MEQVLETGSVLKHGTGSIKNKSIEAYNNINKKTSKLNEVQFNEDEFILDGLTEGSGTKAGDGVGANTSTVMFINNTNAKNKSQGLSASLS